MPVKITVVANKSKTTIKAISKFSNLWIAGRLLLASEKKEQNNEGSNDNMFKKMGKAISNFGKLIWANKKSIIGLTCQSTAIPRASKTKRHRSMPISK